MIRAVVEEALLFLLPFAAFALFLVVRRRKVLHWPSWSDQSAWLVITGLSCAILALVVTGLTSDRETRAFVPPHMENGRVVPGQFR